MTIAATPPLTAITTIINVDNLFESMLLGSRVPEAFDWLEAFLDTGIEAVLVMCLVADEGVVAIFVESIELVGKEVTCGTEEVKGVSLPALGVL